MIITKTVKIKVLNHLINHYSEKGYDIKANCELEIDVKDLSHGSNYIIEFECDSCKQLFSKKFRLITINSDLTTLCSHCKQSLAAKERVKKYGTAFSDSLTQQKNSTKYKNNSDKLLEIQEKRKRTNQSKYGDCNNQKKRKETIKNLDINWNNSEKRKKTCLEKYGSKNWNNQEKKRKTCIEKYGVEHTQQLQEIFSKTCKFHKYKETILYQGSYEKDFLDNFYGKLDIERGKTFSYIDENNINRKYFSDFFIPSYNLVIEIKSKYTWERDTNKYLKKEAAEKNHNFMWIINKEYDILIELLNV